jgi:predicted HNH restriction endonuclease
MKQQKNIKISALLLLIVSIPILYLVVLLSKQQIVKYKTVAKLEASYLQQVTIHVNNVKWTNEEKEVFINNELFDIESYSIKKDSIQFVGLYDTDEETIIKNLNQTTDQSNAATSNQKILNLLFLPYYFNNNFFSFQATWRLISNRYLPYNITIPNYSSYVITLPPKSI